MSKLMELVDAYAGIPHDTYFRKEKEEARAVLAAEIERVEAENAKLRDALERVCSHGTRTSQQIDADWDFARAAIKALQALSQQGEPVAWMIWLHGPAGFFEHKQLAELEFQRRNNAYPDSNRKLLPLYAGAAPAAQPEPDEAGHIGFQEWWDSIADEYEVNDFKKMRRAWNASLQYAPAAQQGADK